MDNFLEGTQKLIPADDARRQQFASASISLLAVNLTKVLTQKYVQVQQIGGLSLSKQVEGDQLQFEYEASKEFVSCGALQMLKDIHYLKKMLRRFCQDAAATESKEVFTSRQFEGLNAIQMGCALAPLITAAR